MASCLIFLHGLSYLFSTTIVVIRWIRHHMKFKMTDTMRLDGSIYWPTYYTALMNISVAKEIHMRHGTITHGRRKRSAPYLTNGTAWWHLCLMRIGHAVFHIYREGLTTCKVISPTSLKLNDILLSKIMITFPERR